MTTLVALLLALTPTERAAQNRITPQEVSAHIRFLSDDQLEGRKPGSAGDELAIKYLASQLEAMGYKPAGDNGTYLQSVPLIELAGEVPHDVTFQAGANNLTLHANTGMQADLVLGPSAHKELESVENAPVVFAGYGITAPEYGWDDYKDTDVRGKVVVLLNFNPPFKGEGVRLWYGRWDYKYLNAARHGAAGAIIVHTTESAGYPWQVVVTSWSTPHQNLPPEPKDKFMEFQGWVTEAGAMQLAKLGGKELDALRAAAKNKDFKPVQLGSTLSLRMPVQLRRINSANVVGILPGTDAKLRDEAVLYTAHHDHLGKVTPVPPATDGIYNGALDNASGCATVLAIARAVTFAQPKRSVIVSFVTAEEQGLLGSEFLGRHPPIPANRIAADINLDSVNRWGKTTDLGVLGLGKSTTDEVVRKVAGEQGRTVHGDPHPDRGAFYRSDMFSMARVGVPPVAVKGGPDYAGKPKGWGDEQMLDYERKHYHQPSDEYRGDWDLSGDVQDAQLQLVVGLRIANAPQLPSWTPGDEFEAARKQASR
ncbi:MAG TPA: M28 family peptidase [Myxococcales bacterium]|nr:M28 family peptidase [Myxococcales bacterium]